MRPKIDLDLRSAQRYETVIASRGYSAPQFVTPPLQITNNVFIVCLLPNACNTITHLIIIFIPVMRVFPKINRFVVLFEGRTGSTYLTESLNKHPYVRAEGEILVSTKNEDWGAQKEIVTNILKRPKFSRLHAVGFKTKLRDIINVEQFGKLLRDQKVLIIYMNRHNRVKTVVSMLRSRVLKEKVGDYNARSNDLTLGKIILDPDIFDELLKMREELDKRLRTFVEYIDLPTTELFYEDMLSDEELFFTNVCKFLEVPYIASRGETVKNTSDNLSESVENFDELRSRYSNTAYKYQFDT